jgi:hypothetical protein
LNDEGEGEGERTRRDKTEEAAGESEAEQTNSAILQFDEFESKSWKEDEKPELVDRG